MRTAPEDLPVPPALFLCPGLLRPGGALRALLLFRGGARLFHRALLRRGCFLHRGLARRFFFDELTDAFLEELFFDEAIFLDEREDDFLALYLELP